MKKCTYCGRESEERFDRCPECGTEFSITPSTITSPPTQSRYPLIILGLLLVGSGVLGLLLVISARIDSPEELDMALRQALPYAAPLAAGAMFLALDAGRRWKKSLQIAFALIVCLTVWLLGWQLQVQAHYWQLRARGVDPDEVLRRSKLRSALPNRSVSAMPADYAILHFRTCPGWHDGYTTSG